MRKAISITILIISSFLITRAVFAYDNETTHPALTNEAVDFYNLNFDQKLTSEEKEWIIQGSILEDTVPRWINHFYDPIYKVGWTGEEANKWLSKEIVQKFSDVVLSPESAVSALNWVHNQELQAKYKRYLGNKTWEKALYEYAKNKNKQEAFLALGHVLHLVEDMAVPEHTRNDTHPGDSPYENYCTRFTRSTWQIVDELQKQNFKPIILDSLDEYFEELASYSNNYFFSKDTINDPKYDKPKIIREEGGYSYGKDRDGGQFILTTVKEKTIFENNQFKNIKIYLLLDTEEYEPILQSYWTRLSRASVLNSAGIIRLFFEEVEKAEQDESLLKPPPANQSAIISVYGEIVKIGAAIANTTNVIGNTATNLWNKLTGADEQSSAIVQSSASLNDVNSRLSGSPEEQAALSSDRENLQPDSSSSLFPPSEIAEAGIGNEGNNNQSVEPGQTPTSSLNPNQNPVPPSLPYPGFGGGGPVSSSQNTHMEDNSSANPLDTIPPGPPIIISPDDFSQIFTSANIVFSGTAEASSTISTSFNNSTTIDSSGNWFLTLNLNQGSTLIKFFAKDAAGNISSSTDISLFVDSIIPTVDYFSILECSNSVATSTCFLTASTLHLTWQSGDEDLDYFELIYNNQTSTTTATSTEIVVADNSINNFSVRAKDMSGNWSGARNVSAEFFPTPVIINEVAWAGTAPNHFQDEWIELYNKTNQPINLDNWILYSQTDQKPYINLSGLIPSKGYYLIERTDDNTVNGDSEGDTRGRADWSGSFGSGEGEGLDNTNGEVLILSYASTTIDQTPSGHWAGGDSGTYRTMERFNPDLSGSDAGSWGTNNTLIRNGKNVDNQPINGTPKARNSANYLISKGQPYISSDITLTEANSPYFVGEPYSNLLQVFQDNAVLTVEPGVVIKFYNNAGFSFIGNSKIIARGEVGENKQVIFTSFFDDNYGGDLNNDATSTSPHPGNWYGIEVQSTNNDLVFDHTVFRYGGWRWDTVGNHGADLSVKNSSAAITNSIFEHSKYYGLKLENSNSTVSNNILRSNNNETDTAGYNAAMVILGGSPIVHQSNNFSNNYRGIFLSDSGANISSNQFASNTDVAIYSSGSLAGISGNSGSGNGIDGIVISGNLTRQNETATLKPNSLAYVLDNSTPSAVIANSTLAVEPGIIVKGSGGIWGSRLYIDGNLVFQGSNPGDVVFTSLFDDYGGDTNNDATSTSPHNGDWQGIIANPGSITDIKGATFAYADKAISYYNSPIKLENVRFENNNLAVYVDPAGFVTSMQISDDFENYNSGNLNGQGGWSGSPMYQIQNSVVYDGNKAISSGTGGIGYISKNLDTQTPSGKQAIYGRASQNALDNGTPTFVIIGDNGEMAEICLWSSGIKLMYDSYYCWNTPITLTSAIADTWFKLEIEWGNEGKVRGKVNEGTWSEWVSPINSFSIATSISIGSAMGGDHYWDDLTAPSPSAEGQTIYGGQPISISTIEIENLGNIATTSPAGLW
jgi:hypothetical protein